MKTKNILIIPIAALMILATITGALAADDWTTGVSYSIGDVVTYQGTDYECVQAHTSQEGWQPPNVAALWQVVADPDDNTWTAGVAYQTGDVVLYNNETYKVRQSHTAQSDWKPSQTLALYKPVVENKKQVNYLPEESNYDATEYVNMTRGELIEFMDFEYVGVRVLDNRLEYTWSYLHPQLSGDSVQWLYKPMTQGLHYDEIQKCLDANYTQQQCFNGLVTGTETITYSDGTNETTEVTSILEKAENKAVDSVNYAQNLQQELTKTLDLDMFSPDTLGVTVN